VTVTATAKSGYVFTNWTANGTVQSASPSYSFTLATNTTLVANFAVKPTTNTVVAQVNPANAGSVSGGGSFVTGSSVTVTATANSGYIFTNWTANGIAQSSSPSYSFTLATNSTLVANFIVNPSPMMTITCSSNKATAINFLAASGQTYTVQASTDLKNWETIWQSTSTSNACVQFQDPAAPSLQMRFYRTVTSN
jgi:hypothetical protein